MPTLLSVITLYPIAITLLLGFTFTFYPLLSLWYPAALFITGYMTCWRYNDYRFRKTVEGIKKDQEDFRARTLEALNMLERNLGTDTTRQEHEAGNAAGDGTDAKAGNGYSVHEMRMLRNNAEVRRSSLELAREMRKWAEGDEI